MKEKKENNSIFNDEELEEDFISLENIAKIIMGLIIFFTIYTITFSMI